MDSTTNDNAETSPPQTSVASSPSTTNSSNGNSNNSVNRSPSTKDKQPPTIDLPPASSSSSDNSKKQPLMRARLSSTSTERQLNLASTRVVQNMLKSVAPTLTIQQQQQQSSAIDIIACSPAYEALWKASETYADNFRKMLAHFLSESKKLLPNSLVNAQQAPPKPMSLRARAKSVFTGGANKDNNNNNKDDAALKPSASEDQISLVIPFDSSESPLTPEEEQVLNEYHQFVREQSATALSAVRNTIIAFEYQALLSQLVELTAIARAKLEKEERGKYTDEQFKQRYLRQVSKLDTKNRRRASTFTATPNIVGVPLDQLVPFHLATNPAFSTTNNKSNTSNNESLVSLRIKVLSTLAPIAICCQGLQGFLYHALTTAIRKENASSGNSSRRNLLISLPSHANSINYAVGEFIVRMVITTYQLSRKCVQQKQKQLRQQFQSNRSSSSSSNSGPFMFDEEFVASLNSEAEISISTTLRKVSDQASQARSSPTIRLSVQEEQEAHDQGRVETDLLRKEFRDSVSVTARNSLQLASEKYELQVREFLDKLLDQANAIITPPTSSSSNNNSNTNSPSVSAASASASASSSPDATTTTTTTNAEGEKQPSPPLPQQSSPNVATTATAAAAIVNEKIEHIKRFDILIHFARTNFSSTSLVHLLIEAFRCVFNIGSHVITANSNSAKNYARFCKECDALRAASLKKANAMVMQLQNALAANTTTDGTAGAEKEHRLMEAQIIGAVLSFVPSLYAISFVCADSLRDLHADLTKARDNEANKNAIMNAGGTLKRRMLNLSLKKSAAFTNLVTECLIHLGELSANAFIYAAGGSTRKDEGAASDSSSLGNASDNAHGGSSGGGSANSGKDRIYASQEECQRRVMEMMKDWLDQSLGMLATVAQANTSNSSSNKKR